MFREVDFFKKRLEGKITVASLGTADVHSLWQRWSPKSETVSCCGTSMLFHAMRRPNKKLTKSAKFACVAVTFSLLKDSSLRVSRMFSGRFPQMDQNAESVLCFEHWCAMYSLFLVDEIWSFLYIQVWPLLVIFIVSRTSLSRVQRGQKGRILLVKGNLLE